MPSLYVVEDKGTLPHLVALAGIGGKFSNIKKKIVRCGNYEFHHQHHQSAQIELLLNMFDNYRVIFLTGPPLTMSINWPPQNLLGLAPPNCWNHIHFARHLDIF